jgi:hypothetical protein
MANKQISNLYQAQSNSIASYDYVDIAEGTGQIIFQGYGNLETTNTTYGIRTNPTRANPANYSSPLGANTIYFYLSLFNKPKTIKGTARIEGTMAMSSAQGAVSGTGYITFTFQHWDGTTATNMGAVTTKTMSIGSDYLITEHISMEVSLTQTHFKRGDILRVATTFVHTGSNTSFKLAFDPLNIDMPMGQPVHPTWATDASNYPSTLKFYIPFRLDEIGL